MIKILSKTIVVTLAALSTIALSAPSIMAGQRYATPPPLVLSPDLTQPMMLQLRDSRSIVHQPAQNVVQRYAFQGRLLQNERAVDHPRQFRSAVLRKKRRTGKRRAQNRKQFDPALLPTLVNYSTSQKPGTIVVNTAERRLYLVMANGKARRYGVGVGRTGFQWSGTNRITRKAEWPTWRPPAAMIARERAKGKFLPAVMKGGINNPLGARAMYLGTTLYRLHGSNQEWSIGKAVSSGCIRLRNQDAIDLYQRVKVGTKVVVL